METAENAFPRRESLFALTLKIPFSPAKKRRSGECCWAGKIKINQRSPNLRHSPSMFDANGIVAIERACNGGTTVVLSLRQGHSVLKAKCLFSTFQRSSRVMESAAASDNDFSTSTWTDWLGKICHAWEEFRIWRIRRLENCSPKL